MLRIDFEGYWQCRFATDPDPSDDPHGRSGPTFTVPGEPPFDRIVRFQRPVHPRYPHEHDIGVRVVAVRDGDTPLAGHPLIGAPVDLRDDGQFRQRNLVYVDQPFQVFVDPLVLAVGKSGMLLERAALWDVTRPGLTVDDVFLEPELMATRANQIEIQSAEVAEATGLLDYDAARRRRRDDLVALLEKEADPTRKAALEKRIGAIDNDQHLIGQRLAATQFMGMKASWDLVLNGTPTVDDGAGRLGGTVGTSQPWRLAMWFGGYDVDALTGYARGSLSVPFRRATG